MRRNRKADDTSPTVPLKVWSDAPAPGTPASGAPVAELGDLKIKWDPSWTTGAKPEKAATRVEVTEQSSAVAVLDGAAPSQTPTPRESSGKPIRIGELLVDHGLITPEQLDLALAEQSVSGRRLGSELINLGMLTERQFIETLADQMRLPVADLRMTTPEKDAVERFPEELARKLEAVPLRMIGDTMEIALADVLGDRLRADLEAGAGCAIVAVLAPPSEILNAIDRAYLVIGGVESQVESFRVQESARPKADATKLEVDDKAPIVQVVMLLLTQAVRDRASDVHIEPQGDKVRVRFRIDGVMREIVELPESMAQSLVSRLKVLADMNIVERRRSQDGQIAIELDGRPLDIRVSIIATVFGEKAVLRILDKTRSLKSLHELGMSKETSSTIAELVTSPFGMVVCAGPTGSGKTTSLYAALKSIDEPTRNITTIEDPVEYVVPTINQIQVNNQAGVTFADGLRTILRQDPDVILIGEIRDVETARIAVQSALTGHLVLSSVHATNSATSIQRFRDMGIEPFLLTSSLLAVLSQRLVRRICPHCRTQYAPTPSERLFFTKATGIEKETFWHGAGCNLCTHTGYSHRVGVYELLNVTEAIREQIVADAGSDVIMATARSEGMRTLQDEALRLVTEDVTTIEEAARTVFAR
ncbi:MAG: type pilus assembly protein PilB [Actinomycetota bacterium]|nr:type pilus assembly protein PilB [Actinomycetota bacterium]